MSKPWENAFEWISNMGIISSTKEQTNLVDKDLKFFMGLIMDGILLCQIVNHLSPNAGLSPIKNANSQFSWEHNINLFIKCLKTEFNISDNLLEASDIIEFKNIGNV